MLLAPPTLAWAALTPSTATVTLGAGSSTTEMKTVDVPSRPPAIDIELAVDTTGSMGTAIAQARADAMNIVNAIKSAVADTQFAVVQFRDYGDTPEYQVVQSMTGDATLVQAATNLLFAAGGGDYPEAHNLVFQNSFTPLTGGTIGWRTGTRKFVIVLSDAPPHGNLADQGFTACGNQSADPHGLVTSTMLNGMLAASRTLMMLDYDVWGYLPLSCYQALSTVTGGNAAMPGGDLATQILSLVSGSFNVVSDLHLEVVSASTAGTETWITLPAALGPVAAPSSQTFGVLTVTVPAGTAAGTYVFDIRAVGDGADLGHQTLTVNVPSSDSYAPSCGTVSLDATSLWPPDHSLARLTVSGGTDGDIGDSVSLVIDGVSQDEPVNGLGDGDTGPDAFLLGTDQVLVRAERSGKGNGRFYKVHVTGTDRAGRTCERTLEVVVPHDSKQSPLDSGAPYYNSTVP